MPTIPSWRDWPSAHTGRSDYRMRNFCGISSLGGAWGAVSENGTLRQGARVYLPGERRRRGLVLPMLPARARGDPSRPRNRGRGRELPRGLLLSPVGNGAGGAGAARAAGGHPPARGALPRAMQPPAQRRFPRDPTARQQIPAAHLTAGARQLERRRLATSGILLRTTSQALPRSACGRRARRARHFTGVGLSRRNPSRGMGRAARARYPEAWDVSRPCIVRETPSTSCSTRSSPSTWRLFCARRRRPATGRACRRSSSASSGSS